MSINRFNGVRTASFINNVKQRLCMGEALPAVFLLAKDTLISNGLNEVYTGGLGSFCLCVCVASFVSKETSVLNGSFDKNRDSGPILIRFFKFMTCEFLVERDCITIDDLHASRSVKFPKNHSDIVCVQDPLNHENNLAKGTWNWYNLVNVIEIKFNKFNKILNLNSTETTVLGNLIQVNPQVTMDRQKVLMTYNTLKFKK